MTRAEVGPSWGNAHRLAGKFEVENGLSCSRQPEGGSKKKKKQGEVTAQSPQALRASSIACPMISYPLSVGCKKSAMIVLEMRPPGVT